MSGRKLSAVHGDQGQLILADGNQVAVQFDRWILERSGPFDTINQEWQGTIRSSASLIDWFMSHEVATLKGTGFECEVIPVTFRLNEVKFRSVVLIPASK